MGGVTGWKRPKPGDGRALRSFRRTSVLTRTRFELRPDATLFTVDVDQSEETADLYRDRVQVATSALPARFPVDGGVIEVSASLYGMRRVHLVRPDGSEQRLEPARGTLEHGRAVLGRRHPGVSRTLAAAAVTVLVVDLVLFAPQALEFVSHLDLWPDILPVFDSPISLPAWANIALTVAGVLAGTERALTFRHNRLLDAEVGWVED